MKWWWSGVTTSGPTFGTRFWECDALDTCWPEIQVPEKRKMNKIVLYYFSTTLACKRNSLLAHSSARELVCIDASIKESTIGGACPPIVEGGRRPPSSMEASVHAIFQADE